MWFFQETKRAQLTEDSRIIINIWLPKVQGKSTSAKHFLKSYLKESTRDDDRIGHVSVETPNIYVSWWPNPSDEQQVNIFNVVNSQNSTYAQDCENEGGDPNLRICLYSLDIAEVEDCFRHVETSGYGYVLAGDKAVTRYFNTQKGQSCAGLAYEILMIGGLKKLINFYRDLEIQWLFVDPYNLSNLLKHAKEAECKLYPETQGFVLIDAEYSSEQVGKCVIL